MSARTVDITSPMWWSVQALPFIYQGPCDNHLDALEVLGRTDLLGGYSCTVTHPRESKERR